MTKAGLAAGRTALAWRRTAVAAMGTAAVFINHAVVNGWRHAASAPLIAAIMLVALAIVGVLRDRALHHGTAGRPDRAVTATSVVIVLVCAVAVFIGLRDPVA